jgi:prepilin-type N-terminal cleavage/methylation domain-containing protein
MNTIYKKIAKSNKEGFTLLELLIVITIIAVLSVILILVIDPAETLKKSRDAQRISDLNTLKTAIGIYTTGTSTVFLGSATTSVPCKTGTGGGSYTQGVSRVFYSVATGTVTATVDGGASSSIFNGGGAATDGTGWVPIYFDTLISGSPISNEPLDPTNSVKATPDNADLVYRYTCNASTTKWEADAVLESNAFTSADNKMVKDGGNNPNYYEAGTSLQLLGAGTNF